MEGLLCVECLNERTTEDYPIYTMASVIYKGMSICGKHMKRYMEGNKT